MTPDPNMLPCPHTQCLDLDGLYPAWSLVDPGRLKRLVDFFDNPEAQYPSIVLFIGKKSKTDALKGIFTNNNTTRRSSHGIANLHVDLGTTTSAHPLIFADCTLNAVCTGLVDAWNACHDSHHYPIGEDSESTSMRLNDIVSRIHVNLLLPFTHVVWLFASDMGGNRACVSYVESWLRIEGSMPNTEIRSLPHLVIATNDLGDPGMLVQLECHTKFNLVFGSLTIVNVEASPRATDPSKLFLQAELRRILDQARKDRFQCNLLFSAKHLVQTFSAAIGAFAKCPQKVVNIFSCSGHPGAQVTSAGGHLKAFLSAGVRLGASSNSISEFIASAFLAQGYPPYTHRGDRHSLNWTFTDCLVDYPPEVVFREFFQGQLDALRLPDRLSEVNGIRSQFMMLFDELCPDKPAIVLRRGILAANQSQWKYLQSTTTCFACLFRFSERRLPCGHSMCEDCIESHYPRSRGPYSYSVGSCLLCGIDAKMIIDIKPVTVEPNVGAIDGGGVRGIIALILLKRLQDALDSGHPLRDYFDYFAGTSAGMFLCTTEVALS
jgi:hypothetical protein